MVLQHLNPATIGIKLASTTVHLKHDGSIKIGDRELEGAGEYDIAGVGVQVFTGAAFLFCENIRLGVFGSEAAGSQEDINCDILVVLTPEAKQMATLIKELDPRIVVVHDDALAHHLETNDGASLVREATYKVTAATLPTEDRVFVALG